jgi:hypothetical protein
MTEPDSGLWTTEAGLPGAIVRHVSIGILCGYVAVPRGHRAYGKTTADFLPGGSTALDFGPEITYANAGPETRATSEGPRDAAWWWIGFDCNHVGDGTPVSAPGNPRGMEQAARDVYRTWGVVRAWVEELAGELGGAEARAGRR